MPESSLSNRGGFQMNPWLYVAAAVLGLSALPGVSGAAANDLYFTVNPIRVCNHGGASCTTVNTFSAQTQKIYEQAGVAPVFLPTTQINSTASLSAPSVSNVAVAGNGQSADTATINMW